MRRDLRLGGLIGIYRLIKSDRASEINEDVINMIIEEVFITLFDYEA